MFQFTGFPPARYKVSLLHMQAHRVFLCGFPHSDTHGLSRVCRSPWLFAACRVFLRPPAPRHPPRALLRLTLPLHKPSVTYIKAFIVSFFRFLVFDSRCCSCFCFLSRYSVFKVRSHDASRHEWRLRDSNSRPPACKAGALPTELSPLLAFSLFFFLIPAATCFPAFPQYHRPPGA